MHVISPYTSILNHAVVLLNLEHLTPKQAEFLTKLDDAIQNLIVCWAIIRLTPQRDESLHYRLIDAISTTMAYGHALSNNVVGPLTDQQRQHIQQINTAINALCAEIQHVGVDIQRQTA